MKKIITLLTILLLSKFSFAATHPVADISSLTPAYSNCSNGGIGVSNIHNLEGLFFGAFDVYLNKWNGSGYVNVGYHHDVGAATSFLNLPPGDYQIHISFIATFDPNFNGDTYYYRSFSFLNLCPVPTISSIVNASSNCSDDGYVTMSNGDVFYNLSPGSHDLSGNINCGCGTYTVNASVSVNDPPATISSIQNASSPLCSDGIVYISNGDTFYNLSPGLHNLTGSYKFDCGNSFYYTRYTVPAYVNSGPCNFDFSAIVTDTITNCSSGSLLITTNNPACVQYYIVRVFDNDGNLVYNVANDTTSPSELPLKINLSPGGHYSVTMDAYGSNGGVCSAAHDVDIDPGVTFTGSTTVCFSSSTTLTASGGSSYLWQPGNLSGAVQTFTSNTAGSIDYTVYTASSDSTCFDTATVTVTTLAATTATISGGNHCALNTLTANSNSTPANFVWKRDSTEVSNSATDPTYTPTAPGSYTVEITDINGCTATSPAFVIHDVPNITFTGKSTACTGLPDTITASGASTYRWQPGNLTGAMQSFTKKTTGVTVYTVSAANNDSTCFDVDSFAISTFINPTVSISGTTCINNTFSATVKKSPADNLVWNLNNNAVQTTNTGWQANATTILGGHGAGALANQLNLPRNIFVDSKNNLFVVDQVNQRVQKLAPGSTQAITVAGGNGQGNAPDQLSNPVGLFVDRFGNIFIADHYNHRIQKWAPGATQGITVAGGNGQGNAPNQLNYPVEVIVDELGNIYISDEVNNRVQKWAPGATEGITVAELGTDPYGISLDADGNLYIVENSNLSVIKWKPGATSGVIVAGGNGSGSGANQFSYPAGLFVDGLGNIYVADRYNGRIQEWIPGATSGVTIAGTGGLGSGASQLYDPSHVFVDANGNIYVSDEDNNRIQKFARQTDSTYIPTATGSYQVQVNDFNGCGANSNALVIKNIVPGAPGAITGQATNLCSGGIFNYSIAQVTNASSYTWTVPANCSIQSGQGSLAISVSIPANFTTGNISVVANNACSGTTGAPRSLTVIQFPAKPSAITGPSTVTANQTNLQFSITNNETNVSYIWSLPAGATIVSGQGTNTVTVNWGNKTGNIVVYAHNSCGNSVTVSKKVTVGTALSSKQAIAGSYTKAGEEFRLYPNPAKGRLYLSFSGQGQITGSIIIHDADGKTILLQSNQSLNNNMSIDISKLSNGAYLVEVITNNNRMTAKLIVEK